MRCIWQQNVRYHVSAVLGEMWAMFQAVFTILLPLFALNVAFYTGDIIYLPFIIRRLHGLLQCRPTMLCIVFENRLKNN